MRHAEAAAAPGVRDHDQPITPAGRAAAAEVARALGARGGWTPQVAVCSNAARSRQTLDAMRAALPALEDADAHALGRLYATSQLDGATRGALEAAVAAEARVGDGVVLVLGHK
jgi:phosphohistidine phosphatase SixA